MNHKRLAQLSIGFVILIFLSQAYLIVRLFHVNYTYLGKVVSTITQDVYTKDLNSRLEKISTIAQPRVEVGNSDMSIWILQDVTISTLWLMWIKPIRSHY